MNRHATFMMLPIIVNLINIYCHNIYCHTDMCQSLVLGPATVEKTRSLDV